MEYLFERYRKKLAYTRTSFVRSIMDTIHWDAQLIGIRGARGVGKTTLLLQYIKLHLPSDHTVLYVSLDNIWFTGNRLYNLADDFVKNGGKYLFLDEVHKYPGWSQEIKNIYDDYPELKVVFTGSSLLEILNAKADLSRRAIVYEIQGFSFREYLNRNLNLHIPVCSMEEILDHHMTLAQSITSGIKVLKHFNDYLKNGYFPYFMDNPNFYVNTLLKNINLALEIDVPYINQIELKYLSKLRKLLHIIASETPFTPNVSKLANSVETSRATIMNYLKYLKNARLIQLLYSNGDDDQMKKPDKVYMHITNLLYAISPNNTDNLNLRQTFFYNQVGYNHRLKSSPKGDFCVNGKYHFVVGGRKIEATNDVYAASDVIEIGEDKKIPLWLFGFLY